MKKVRILLILIVLLSMIGAIVYFNDNTCDNHEHGQLSERMLRS